MPTSTVKEDWRMRRLVQSVTPSNNGQGSTSAYRAQLGFTVSYPVDEFTVRSQMQAAGYYMGAFHPQSAILACTSIDVDLSLFNLARVTVLYEQRPDEIPDLTNPLMVPPRIRYHGNNSGVQVDRDMLNKPIVNSAGDAFSNAPVIDKRSRGFTIIKNLPFYTLALDIQYANTCNSTPWNPLGIGTLDIGQAKCLGIMPTGEVTRTMSYVEVAYDFEVDGGLRQVNLEVDDVWDGFQLTLLDQGPNGWWTNGGNKDRGTFLTNDGTREMGDVLLDGTGKPINTRLKVGSVGNSHSTTSVPTANASSAYVTSVSNPSAVFLSYQKTLFSEFNDFGF